jgi:hypothetical protein
VIGKRRVGLGYAGDSIIVGIHGLYYGPLSRPGQAVEVECGYVLCKYVRMIQP